MSTYSGKKIIVVLLAAILALSVLPVTSWSAAQGLGESSMGASSGNTAAGASVGFSTISFNLFSTAMVTITTFEELEEAVRDAVDGAVIAIANDISFDQAIVVSTGQNLTITAAVEKTTLSAASGQRHFIVESGAELLLASENLVLDGNKDGGGIHSNGGSITLDGPTITNCSNAYGGGIAVSGGALTIEDGTISNNKATGNSYKAAGGGGVSISDGTFTMNGGKIFGNTTDSSNYGSGGGVCITDGSNFDMNGGEIFGNEAKCGGAGAYVADSSTFIMNSSKIYGNKSRSAGAGIDLSHSTFIMMNDSKVYENEATYSSGGGVDAFYSAVTIIDSEIYGNTASSYSGVYVNKGTLTIEGSKIFNNTAKAAYNSSMGAGVNSYESSFSMKNSDIFGNTSESGNANAGGLYIFDKSGSNNTHVIQGCRIFDNSAKYNGGGVFISFVFGTITIKDCEIYGNSTNGNGGGVYVWSNTTTLEMENVKIFDNSAGGNGGGIGAYDGARTTLKMENVKISGNTAGVNGGGIGADNGTLFMEDVEISGNAASTGDGGGIYTTNLANIHAGETVVFKDNLAPQAYIMTDENDINLHNTNIKANNFSSGFQYGYNNYDISYTKGTLVQQFYTVTFDSQGGTAVLDQQVVDGGYITEPIDIFKEGHTLDGWYVVGTDTKWNFATPITKNVDLVARWDANSYTVTFDSNGGTTVADKTVKHDELVSKPDVTKQGHTLDSWYVKGTDDKWDFSTPVTGNVDLIARWDINSYAVIFDANGGSPEPDQQSIDYGEKAREPAKPQRGDDIFLGWYTEGGVEWDFQQQTVSEDLKLIAHWKIPDVPDPIKYTVTFDTDGGTPIPADQTVLEGGKAVKPVQPSKEGYIFDGWYNEAALWDFDKDAVNTNITLTARWTEKPTTPPEKTEYTVRFDTDGGTPVPQNQKVEKGEKAASPAENPIKSGYSFTGWYYQGNLWNFDDETVEGNMVLIAGWKANESSGGSDKDSGSNKPDDLDGNTDEETAGGSSTGGSGGSGSRDRGSSVSVGRDVYINDLDVPLANELLSIFDEEVPLTEVRLAESNLFDIPDTGIKRSAASLMTVGAIALAALTYKRED